MNEKRPLIITFIGDISFLGALLSIVILLFPNFSERFGFYAMPLPVFSEGIMQVLLPIILLIASYGFLKLKRWGYWLMIIYDMFFLIVFIIGYHSQNVMITFIDLVFILPTRKYFCKKISTS